MVSCDVASNICRALATDEIAASIDTDGEWTISAQAFDVGPLQFMQDMLNINPWQWYDDIAANDPDSDIVQGIGALKKLTYDFLSCERLTLMFMMTGDGEQMLIASATGCNLLLIKLSFTVLVIDWSDVMVMISVELGDFTFASAFKSIHKDLETLGMLMDLATMPVKCIKRLDIAFATVAIKKPEFRNEEYGLPSLSYIPRGFSLGLRLDLISQIQDSLEIIGKIMSESFSLEDPMGPFKTFFEGDIWSPLADWPFTIGFDIETISVSFSTALEFTGGGLPIGDIRFKSMRVIFSAKLSDDLEFSASGELTLFYDIHPPLEIFNTMFGRAVATRSLTGAMAEAWCLLIHAELSLFLSIHSFST
jgi:hypothetical protein